MSDLSTSIDTTYPDRDAGDAQHQQDHDAIHALYNELKGTQSAAGLATLRALLDGTYVAQADESSVFLPGPAFKLLSGSASESNTAGYPLWLFDAAGTEAISTSWLAPQWWTTFNVKARIANTAAVAGDVVIQMHYKSGTSLSGGSTAVTAVTHTVRSDLANQAEEVTVASGLSVVTSPFHLRFSRLGGDAADTLANDLSFVGYLLERAS